ncbi:hypothetical protein M2403_001052 [Rahnella sp. BIGb0603]|nr:hypothetical protein [Rahnella sp. BIGb0603]
MKSSIINGSEVSRLSVAIHIRDGMYLELSEAGTSPFRQIAEVFYSDVTHEFSFSCYEGCIPLKEIEKLIHEAKKLLPPAKQEP